MIRCLSTLVVLAFAAFVANTKETDAAPEITFEQTSHDFGTIREDNGTVKCTFTYTNTGNAPLALTTVSAPCGCTTPKYSHKPLAPGKKGTIEVKFSPKDIKGEFIRSISVWTNVKNGKGKKKVTLKISGVVVPKK